jgi:hypothetical protein
LKADLGPFRGPSAAWGAAADVFMAALLLVSWASIPAREVHLYSSLLFAGAVVLHLARRQRALLRLARPPRKEAASRRFRADMLLLGSFALMLGSGLALWASLPAMGLGHGAAGYLMLFLALRHGWLRRQRVLSQGR